MARIGAAEDGVDDRVLRRFLLGRYRCAFQIERDRMAEKLDMGQLLGRRRHQDVADAVVAARAHRLEEILHGDADLALDPADRLLKKLGELRVGLVDANRVLKLGRMVKHDCPFRHRDGMRERPARMRRADPAMP